MTNEEIQVCLQKSQTKYVKLEILNQQDKIVDSLAGLAIDGGYNIDANSALRRTCDIKFILNSKMVINSSSPLWINKRFRLWTGIKNLLTDEIKYFNQGIYLISDPVIDIQLIDKTVSIKGYDKMAYFTGEVTGQLPNKVVIPVDAPISDAIKSTAQTLGGENKLLIDTSPYTVPYEIEKDAGNTIYDILKELQELYKTWKCYYDVNGNFVFTRIKDHINDPVLFDFSIYKTIQTISQDVKYSNIKNYFKVIGKLLDDNTQYISEMTVTNALYPNNPFTVEKMGEMTTRKLIIQEDKYYTQEQCDSRIQYEYFLHSNFAEEISFTTIPLPFLDVDQIVYINKPEYNIVGKYCITNISSGLRHDSLMQLKAYKLH